MRLIICLVLLMMPSLSIDAQEKKALYTIQKSLDNLEIQVQELPLATIRLADGSADGIASYGWTSNSFAMPANRALLDYLGSEQIRNQLDFSGDQTKDFKQFQKEYGKAIQDVYSKFPELKKKDLPHAERKLLNQKVSIEAKKLKSEFSDKIRNTLVPRQLSLIESLKFNQSVNAYGFTRVLSKGQFAEELETTDKQKEELAKIKKETEARIQKVMAEMRAKAKSEMMKLLTTKQKKRIKELEGDKDEKKALNLRL